MWKVLIRLKIKKGPSFSTPKYEMCNFGRIALILIESERPFIFTNIWQDKIVYKRNRVDHILISPVSRPWTHHVHERGLWPFIGETLTFYRWESPSIDETHLLAVRLTFYGWDSHFLSVRVNSYRWVSPSVGETHLLSVRLIFYRSDSPLIGETHLL